MILAVDIYTFGSGSYVVEALQSIKMFMGSSSYVTLVRIAGLIGLLWVLLAALRNKSGGIIQADWSWLLFFAFFYTGLIVPKVDVIINDPLDPPTVASPVVTEVPVGVAYLAYVTSGIGRGMTKAYETFITPIGDSQYSKNGMLFGANVMRSYGEMEFPDASYSADMNQFIGHCLFPQLTTGDLSLDAMSTASDLWTYLKTKGQTNRWISLSDGVVRTCQEAATYLDGKINTQVNKAAGAAGQKLWPTKNLSSAQAAFLAGAGGATATDFLGITQTAADLTRQAMMVRAVSGALEGASIDSGNEAMAQAVYQAKAEAQQRNMYLTMGNMAGRTLPVMKAVMEAIAYAIAPLVFLFILMPGGLVAFGQYALFMVWLQMWPILYAIINSVMYWYGSQNSLNSALLSDGSYGMTLESLNSIVSVNADMVALGGYMAVSIPMIAYMLLKGGLSAGGSVYSGLMQPASSAASASATEQTNGALTLNTLTMDQAGWGNMSANKMDINRSMASGMTTTTDAATGATSTHLSGAGGTITTMLKSDYAYNTQMGNALKSSVNTSASQSVQAARTDASEYMASTTALFSKMQSVNHQVQQSVGTTDTATQQKSSQLASALENMQQAATSLAADTGMSYHTSLGLLGSIGKGIGLSGGANARTQEAYKQATQIADSTGFKESLQTALSLSSQLAATKQAGVADAAGSALQTGVQQNNALAEKAAASFQRAENWSQVQARMEENGVSFSGEISNLMQRELGIGREEFVGMQRAAEQGDSHAVWRLHEMVDTFVAKHGNTLLGMEDAPTQGRVFEANAANQAAVTAQGGIGIRNLQNAGAGSISQGAGTAHLDMGSTTPTGYQAIRAGTQTGMVYDSNNLQSGRNNLQQVHDHQAALIGDMANRDASEAGLERTSDNVLAAVPEPVADTLKFANKGLVDMAATASGLSAGVAGTVERAVTGQAQDWNADFGYGFNRVAQNPVLTHSENGSTQQIKDELFGAGDVAQKKSPVSDAAAHEHLGGNVTRYDSYIQEAAAHQHVPPNLIRAMMQQESQGDPTATSHKGAGGLMQLMPDTAAGVAKQQGMNGYDRYDPRDNIMLGAAYLKQQLDKYDGNISLALAAYNAGPGAVDKHGGIPPYQETQNYVAKITKTYRKLES
ncbi:conjugal transfer protein TraG N-terminal domain-containing protein [Thiothrix lacustris]|uniref:conjugal transfer protein TraG N-terminal domain-containing protein n=1 Tax=Thiothrix lacustris TaxID=525917 RepID=UPI0027E5A47D|nr:conjugal transfer protein TraG N-terminal domain-containing protein [Thiothrix lacustris]WMP17323.1 conjugal transfer protein TraG N-terminal domain-containing protein [Thiothrix lacustris]